MQVFNLEGIAQIAQDLRVDMTRNHQIAADVICHLQTPHHGTNQANPDKGDTLTRAGNSGINRRFCLQCLCVFTDQRFQAVPKKIEVGFFKRLTLK
ncbi:hypothetical protein D3C80_2045560 [compost metagenome]